VSHQPERKEKNCLNCGTTVIGRYCHICGQQNVETKESFWSLTKHFVFDILHFDGNFFHTLKYLLTRPGFVAKQYCDGKRNSYLHPIRMYLFTSAVFFLVFFWMKNENGFVSVETSKPLTAQQRREKIKDYQETLAENPKDSTKYLRRISLLKDTTKPVSYSNLYEGDTTISINSKSYSSIQQYDSIQGSLPAGKKDGWIVRSFSRKTIELSHKYNNQSGEMMKAVGEAFLHRLPYMLFISLPFFALILKVLYVRQKQFYYSDHAIFTLYHYIFSFILLLVIFAVNALGDWLHWGVFDVLAVLLFFLWPLYLWIEMKNFYGQSTGKTLGKFLLLNFLGLLTIILLTAFFFLFSIFQL